MFSCVKDCALQLLFITKKMTCFFVAFFNFIQTITGSDYYGIESPLPYI